MLGTCWKKTSRPSPGLQPARRRAFVCRSSGRLCIHKAHFRHQFLPDPSASTGPASSVADPDHASVVSNPTKCKKEQPPHPQRRAAVAAEDRFNLCFPAERPLAGLVYKTIAVAPAALVSPPGSASSRRQPALAFVLRFATDADLQCPLSALHLPSVKHSPSPIRITPLPFATPTKCKKKQPLRR